MTICFTGIIFIILDIKYKAMKRFISLQQLYMVFVSSIIVYQFSKRSAVELISLLYFFVDIFSFKSQ